MAGPSIRIGRGVFLVGVFGITGVVLLVFLVS